MKSLGKILVICCHSSVNTLSRTIGSVWIFFFSKTAKFTGLKQKSAWQS